MRDEMKRTMFELFGVGSEDDKVLAAGGKKPVAKPEPVKPAPVQAPVQPVVKAKAASYLAAGTSLEGTLRSDGDVEIAGAFKGEIITTGTVTLRSVIQSNITAGSLNLIGCTLTGDVKVTGTVTVSEDSQVTGNINAKELLCAGKVNGDLEITGGTTLEEKAQISGGPGDGHAGGGQGRGHPRRRGDQGVLRHGQAGAQAGAQGQLTAIM